MRQARRGRLGSSFLEIQVALIVLGIGLSGICPLVVMQLKILRKLESPGAATPLLIRGVRIVENQVYPSQGAAAIPSPKVLQPSPDAWVRRLGVPASMVDGVMAQTFSATPSVQMVAVGDPAFSADGWRSIPDASAVGDGVRCHSPGDPASGPAVWNFSGISPGYYRLTAVWSADARNAPDATYKLTGTDGASSTVSPIDQRSAPSPSGLGIFFLDQSIRIELAVSESGRVIADGLTVAPINRVRIVAPVAPTTEGYSVMVGVGTR